MATVGMQVTPKGIGYFAVVAGTRLRTTLLYGREGFLQAIAEAECAEHEDYLQRIMSANDFVRRVRNLPSRYGLTLTPHLPEGRRYSFTDAGGYIHEDGYADAAVASDAALAHFTAARMASGYDSAQRP